MSNDKDSEGKGPPEKGEGYPVGWGKPPRHTQFKKGESGNPKGASARSQECHDRPNRGTERTRCCERERAPQKDHQTARRC